MTKMLTLFGRDLSKLKYKELEREWRSQKQILSDIKQGRLRQQNALDRRIAKEQAGTKIVTSKQIAEDKLILSDIYITHLESFIQEIEYWMGKRIEPLSNRNGHKPPSEIRVRNAKKRKAIIAENTRMYDLQKSLDRDRTLVSWDKEKFMLIAADRGYQTQEAILQDVERELNLDRARAVAIVEKGRFTWGQVLCLGALLQMTPKEFCDTFLMNYFTDYDGEFRADYENISRAELLRTAVRPIECEAVEECKEIESVEVGEAAEEAEEVEEPDEVDVIEVGSDGKPIDEEIWFDS